MPYTDTDKKAHIKELQQYLNNISQANEKIPEVISNGIYGPETIAAVRAFQIGSDLPVTGEVDEITWYTLAEEDKNITKLFSRPQCIAPFPAPNYVINRDERGHLVYIIQIMLNSLANKYSNLPNISLTGGFDMQTQNAVKIFQRISDLSQTGTVDRETWDMLACTFNSYV